VKFVMETDHKVHLGETIAYMLTITYMTTA